MAAPMGMPEAMTRRSTIPNSPMNLNKENAALFQSSLEKAYKHLFANNGEYSYSAAVTTPAKLAEKMTIGLARNEANKDGHGIKMTCKALKIPYTYKGILAYLNHG
jgi:hypothetical protein